MFPILKEKKFTDLSNSNAVVTVESQFDDVAILDNGQRISINRLLDKNYFDEYIDPKTFFGDTYNLFADKIKSVPNEVINQIKDEDESLIIEVDPDYERREMEEKARRMAKSDPTIQSKKQVEMLRDIMGEDEDLPQFPVTNTQVSIDGVAQSPIERVVAHPPISMDPIVAMFRNVKRNRDFKFTIDISEKIPRLDFIEMMEDSYDTSIIDFLAEEFTQKILSDPEVIKSKIIDGIKKMVYPKAKKEMDMICDIPSQPLELVNDGSTPITPSKRGKKSTPKSD